MAYSTNSEFIEQSGLGEKIIDETVGTGDNSETSFDLDKDNIISGTYTLNYAASGSNDFTALTETTDYTLDKDSGKILLTTAGKTELSTNILYATYWSGGIFSDSEVTDMIAKADSEIDLTTGRKWDTPTAITEYRDGVATSRYPTTDEPFQSDYDGSDLLVLKKYPINKIDQLYFLQKLQAISKFFNYDDGSGTYTDKTTEVNSSVQAPFTLFDDAPATGDRIYIGSGYQFVGLEINLSTAGVGASTIDWEYYNGSGWVDITESDVDSGASIFTSSGKFVWVYPYGWATTSVNGETAYWIRGTLTDNYSVDPICATMSLVDSISKILEPRTYTFSDNGTIYLTSGSIPNGSRNVRIDYYYGTDTTPTYIQELAVLLASIKAYVRLSGGSYDDATMYVLGSKTVSIGEVYINIAQVIKEFKGRVTEIYKMIGKRADLQVI